MTETDLIALSLDSTGAILDIVALYFTIVSVYIGALHYFLNRAPFLMRLVAFAFFSGALAFLGITSVAVERTTSGVLGALHKLPHRDALPPPTTQYFGLDSFVTSGDVSVGVWAGWAMTAGIYLALLYLTFSYKASEASDD
ncbi:MAG: hypothetical protein ABWZ40_13580 [Caulobacterales bacterium]